MNIYFCILTNVYPECCMNSEDDRSLRSELIKRSVGRSSSAYSRGSFGFQEDCRCIAPDVALFSIYLSYERQYIYEDCWWFIVAKQLEEERECKQTSSWRRPTRKPTNVSEVAMMWKTSSLDRCDFTSESILIDAVHDIYKWASSFSLSCVQWNHQNEYFLLSSMQSGIAQSHALLSFVRTMSLHVACRLPWLKPSLNRFRWFLLGCVVVAESEVSCCWSTNYSTNSWFFSSIIHQSKNIFIFHSKVMKRLSDVSLAPDWCLLLWEWWCYLFTFALIEMKWRKRATKYPTQLSDQPSQYHLSNSASSRSQIKTYHILCLPSFVRFFRASPWENISSLPLFCCDQLNLLHTKRD